MRTIWKFPLIKLAGIGEIMEIDMPVKPWPTVIHVGKDPNGKECLWALVDPTSAVRGVKFVVQGTGDEVADNHDHRGSWIDGPYVWQLFEVMG